MRSATVLLPQSVEACWRAFTDASLLRAWVPGLRLVTVISRGGMGLAKEILFELASGHTYTLVYNYDVAAHEVRWEPQLGKRDAVRGHAKFEAVDGGTRFTYALEQGDGRSEAERELGSLEPLVAAFAQWMASR
jgi:uncharacterized protein YndB with AHSA1/START domain